MGLPESMTYKYDRYPYVILTPIGRMNKQIRSVGHKFERGLLSRINEAIAVQVNSRSLKLGRLQRYLTVEGHTVLPISYLKDDVINPYLIRPELFLWTHFPKEHGLPYNKEFLYDTNVTQLSSEGLEHHLLQVMDDYLFLAEIAERPKQYWFNKIAEGFHQHPIVQLAHSKRNVIEAVETMNQSALLSQLRYPEDVARWRDRIDTVMRPFRALPRLWLTQQKEMCRHEKQLNFNSRSRSISCRCEVCGLTVFYHLDDDCVTLQEEYNYERASKRITTIEQQFNEIAQKNTSILNQIQELSTIKQKLRPAKYMLDESVRVARQIEKYQEEHVLDSYPLLEMHDQLTCSAFPSKRSPSMLVWLSNVHLYDVGMLKQLSIWKTHMDSQVYTKAEHLLEELQVRLNEAEYTDEDIIITIKSHELSYAYVQQVLDLIHYYGTDYPAHTLVQVLAGKSTNKLRRLKLHEIRWFGLLSDWPSKHIQHLFNQLERQGWLMKQRKGYSISAFAEEVL
ncbi:hypothetical protein MUO14_09965 [Halobacillus shinanisalinarum]|uniref:RQC domain-containing protein n=1 Tax=Halobacillus shinanisalinarum TaxID=2932258 RepID=A0ABY4H439_9BACI|nr:RQC-minor-2 family DNA-binding protein [Halobacillus shinanisalinarum]UOQ95217.1 hypothetical protein MUO14_09965 [Halobacillus shinanisalinarum]